MMAVKPMKKFTQDEFLPVDMSIIGVSIERKYPDGADLNSYSGRITVILDNFPNLTVSFEWLAYHKDSSHQFLKSHPQWFTLYGDWHFSMNGRYGCINMVGFELVDEDTDEPLNENAQHHFVHSVFTENYLWKQNIHDALMRHLKN